MGIRMGMGRAWGSRRELGGGEENRETSISISKVHEAFFIVVLAMCMSMIPATANTACSFDNKYTSACPWVKVAPFYALTSMERTELGLVLLFLICLPPVHNPPQPFSTPCLLVVAWFRDFPERC